MEKWKLKHNPTLDLIDNSSNYIDRLIKSDKYCQNIQNQKFTYSDIVYPEEMEFDAMSLGMSRLNVTQFFHIKLLDGREIYRTAKSIDEIEAKFNGQYCWLKNCTQEEYLNERQKESWKGF